MTTIADRQARREQERATVMRLIARQPRVYWSDVATALGLTRLRSGHSSGLLREMWVDGLIERKPEHGRGFYYCARSEG